MKRRTVEFSVGIFVFITLLCVGYLTLKLGKMEIIGDNYYTLYARFNSVSGLREGSTVEMAGVTIGRVSDISLNQEEYVAMVELKINDEIIITDDAIASIKTSGLIGDKFIKISPGGSPFELQPGDTIIETESPLDMEELMSKYVFGNIESDN